jgi:catechol 2,3-dioxygenase-like lactoylglutathione lyase family enzyme
MHIEHVNLTVSDLDRSLAFYRDLLGFDLRWQGSTSDGEPAAHIGTDACYLALFQGAGQATSMDYGRVGFNHFGVVVDDLDSARRRLEALGGEVHFEPDYEPGRRFYFFDPDGHEVELVEYPGAS